MPGEHAVAATLALALTTLAAIAAVAPGLVLVLSALWLLVARVADRTMTATLRRRYEFGPRSGDVGVAVAALPWRLLSSLPKTVFVLVIPVLLAISAAFLVAGVVAPSAPDPSTGSALAAGCVVGWFAAWWGPGGAVLRRGTRGMTRGLVRSRSAWRAVLVLFAFVLVAALLSANGGAGPDWQPVSSISRIPVPSPDLSGAVDWVLDRIFGFSL